MADPTLELEALLTIPATVTFPIKETRLGDGYDQTGALGKQISFTNYAVTSKYLGLTDSNTLLNQFINWRGVQRFVWTPNGDQVIPRRFVCKQWRLTIVDNFTRQFSGTFEEVIL